MADEGVIVPIRKPKWVASARWSGLNSKASRYLIGFKVQCSIYTSRCVERTKMVSAASSLPQFYNSLRTKSCRASYSSLCHFSPKEMDPQPVFKPATPKVASSGTMEERAGQSSEQSRSPFVVHSYTALLSCNGKLVYSVVSLKPDTYCRGFQSSISTPTCRNTFRHLVHTRTNGWRWVQAPAILFVKGSGLQMIFGST